MAEAQFTIEELAAEEWRPVVGWEGLYEVSNLGRVKSVGGFCNGRWGPYSKPFLSTILRPHKRGRYPRVPLTIDGITKMNSVHRLVVEAFLGKIPEGMVVNHLDNNGWNNRLGNLEITSQKGNVAHAFSIGARRGGTGVWKAKLTEEQAAEIIQRVEAGECQRSIARDLGMHFTSINRLIRHRTWKHLAAHFVVATP